MDRDFTFEILQSIGVLPFLVFLVAPVAFRTAHHRRVLLATLVGMGGYLGITAVMESIGTPSLIFPHYITDMSIGIHQGRSRGPFLEAVTNGTGLYAGAVAAAIAFASSRRPWYQAGAGAVILLCIAGMLLDPDALDLARGSCCDVRRAASGPRAATAAGSKPPSLWSPSLPWRSQRYPG